MCLSHRSSLEIEAGTQDLKRIHLTVADVVIISVVCATTISAASLTESMDLSPISTTSFVGHTKLRVHFVLSHCKKVCKTGLNRLNPDDIKALLLTSYQAKLPKVRVLPISKKPLVLINTPNKYRNQDFSWIKLTQGCMYMKEGFKTKGNDLLDMMELLSRFIVAKD
jgi:hypothetical protein